MQGLVGALTNPVIANGVAGLATSATAQATVQVPSYLQVPRYPQSSTLPGVKLAIVYLIP